MSTFNNTNITNNSHPNYSPLEHRAPVGIMLDKMPDEILLRIFKGLSGSDIYQAGLCNSSLQAISKDRTLTPNIVKQILADLEEAGGTGEQQGKRLSLHCPGDSEVMKVLEPKLKKLSTLLFWEAEGPTSYEISLSFSSKPCEETLNAWVSYQWNLKALDLSHESYTLSDSEAGSLCEALQKNASIESLNLSNCELSDDVASDLANLLKSQCPIKELDLGHNEIWEEGASTLSLSLAKNQTLKSLNLSHNEIDCDGAKSLAKAIYKGHQLDILNLSCCAIGDKGMDHLAAALKKNPAKELSIGYNKASKLSLGRLLVSLAESKTIEKLDISHLAFGRKEVVALHLLLQSGAPLSELNAIGVSIAQDAVKLLLQALSKSTSLQQANFMSAAREGILMQSNDPLFPALRKAAKAAGIKNFTAC